MIPQTAGALLAFLSLVAPGFVFSLLRERRRPAAKESAFREASRVGLSSLVFSVTALLALAALRFGVPRLLVDPGAWVRLGNRYVPAHYQVVALTVLAELVVACGLAAGTAIVLTRWDRNSGNLSNQTAWSEAFRTDCPRGATPWVHARLTDGTSFFGSWRSHTATGDPDQRELTLEGPALSRIRPAADGQPKPAAERIGIPWERVIIPAAQIVYLRIHYLDGNGDVVFSDRQLNAILAARREARS